MLRLAHIINPVAVGEQSDLFVAQPVTFESMRQAQRMAAGEVGVELYAACYPEDVGLVPDFMQVVPLLDRSVMDVLAVTKVRKLPILADILQRLHDSSDADYLIYTNVDIALQPHFYRAVARSIARGADALVINRRTISRTYTSPQDLPLMCAEVGQDHPGFDCFVFRRSAFPRFDLGDACIGANRIGRVLIANVIHHSENFQLIEKGHLTFHLGDDQTWKRESNRPFDDHNGRQFAALIRDLQGRPGFEARPLMPQFAREVRRWEAQQGIAKLLPDLETVHRFEHSAADRVRSVYHTSYRPSAAWAADETPLLSQQPVFMVGFPRSGTTLLQAMLGTQPGIATFPETHFFNRVMQAIDAPEDRVTAACLDEVAYCIRQRVPFSRDAEAHCRDLAGRGELSPKMLLEQVVLDLLVKYGYASPLHSYRWLEKTPDHALRLPVLLRYYPDAKIIFVVRHPAKAILSRRHHFPHERSWPIQQFIDRWKDTVRAVEAVQKLHPDQVRTVRLEDLVRDHARETRLLCDFLGVPFDLERLAGYRDFGRRLVYEWETWKQDVTGREVSAQVSSRDDRTLSAEERAVLEYKLRRYLVRYGYLSANPVARLGRKLKWNLQKKS